MTSRSCLPQVSSLLESKHWSPKALTRCTNSQLSMEVLCELSMDRPTLLPNTCSSGNLQTVTIKTTQSRLTMLLAIWLRTITVEIIRWASRSSATLLPLTKLNSHPQSWLNQLFRHPEWPHNSTYLASRTNLAKVESEWEQASIRLAHLLSHPLGVTLVVAQKAKRKSSGNLQDVLIHTTNNRQRGLVSNKKNLSLFKTWSISTNKDTASSIKKHSLLHKSVQQAQARIES